MDMFNAAPAERAKRPLRQTQEQQREQQHTNQTLRPQPPPTPPPTPAVTGVGHDEVEATSTLSTSDGAGDAPGDALSAAAAAARENGGSERGQVAGSNADDDEKPDEQQLEEEEEDDEEDSLEEERRFYTRLGLRCEDLAVVSGGKPFRGVTLFPPSAFARSHSVRLGALVGSDSDDGGEYVHVAP